MSKYMTVSVYREYDVDITDLNPDDVRISEFAKDEALRMFEQDLIDCIIESCDFNATIVAEYEEVEKEIVDRVYIPVYVIDQEAELAPWYQLYATMDSDGHVEAKWVTTQNGDIIRCESLSSLLDEDSHDARCVRKPLVIKTLTEDPAELRALAEKLTL